MPPIKREIPRAAAEAVARSVLQHTPSETRREVERTRQKLAAVSVTITKDTPPATSAPPAARSRK